MKICAFKKSVLVAAFLCIPFFLSPAFAAGPPPAAKTQAPEAKARPSIKVQDPDYNFGSVLQGTPIEHEFTVRNTGSAVLKISRVQVG